MNLEALTDEELLNLHTKTKNEKIQADSMQLGKKTILNSAYGALSNDWFRYFNDDLAESITWSGQLSIRWIERTFNEYLNKLLETDNFDYVIAVDTDSCYLNFEKLIDKFCPDKTDEEIVDFIDEVCEKKLQQIIDASYQKLADYTNAYDQKMHMSREVISNQGIWTAKKKYLVNMYDEEGVRYKTPKLKMVGISAIQSSTPELCRDSIKEAIKVIIDGTNDDLIEFIEKFRKEFNQHPFEDIAKSMSCNNMQKYYDAQTVYGKKCPIHVRGSLVYNKMLLDKKLDKKFTSIFEGDKVKFCYLLEPNIAGENIISVPSTLPRQLGLDDYIDYRTQFDKVFIQPLKKILDAVRWSERKIMTNDAFFV